VVKGPEELMFPNWNTVALDKEASKFFEGKVESKDVGRPMLPCSFGGVSYYGLCDLRSAINVIPYSFYEEIRGDISPSELQTTDMTIMLADRTLRIPMVILKNIYIYVGPHMFPIDFVVVDMPRNSLCPIIFGRTFLNTAGQLLIVSRKLYLSSLGKRKVSSTSPNFRIGPTTMNVMKRRRRRLPS
jgi:hypothetical protein